MTDFKNQRNLRFLEDYLTERTYIEGNRPSQADVLVLNALSRAPTKATPNVYRWYTHVQSFNAEEKKNFVEKSLNNEVTKFLNKLGTATTGDDNNGDDPFESGEEDAESNSDMIVHVTITLDHKTDVNVIESHVKSIEMPGLVWRDSKVVPVEYELLVTGVVDVSKVNFDEKYWRDLNDKIGDYKEGIIYSYGINTMRSKQS